MTLPSWLPKWIREGLILSDFDSDYSDLPATIAVRDPETIRKFRENRARVMAERDQRKGRRRPKPTTPPDPTP